MTNAAWPEDLKRLAGRMAAAGMAPDIDSMDLSEQRAVYRALRRFLGPGEQRNVTPHSENEGSNHVLERLNP